MQVRNDKYLDLKAQLLFALIAIMGIIIVTTDTVLLERFNYLTNQEERQLDAMYLFLVVPSAVLTGILTHAIWTLRKIKQF